ncbi:MAG: sigma-54 dependent transcriptional regulator [Desulfobacteraceae bacterium]|jgi:DNA-binding NtrC family response regulator
MESKERLLIVDDEPDMLALLRRTLASEQEWEILTASSGRQALETVEAEPVSLVLLDIRMPDLDGMEVLDRLRTFPQGPTVIMMTAYGVIDLAVESIRKGAYDFVTKPFDNTRLVLTLKKAMEYHRLLHENQSLQALIQGGDRFQGMVGSSPKMKEIFETLRMVGKTDATVLVTGESGTGKELVARALHRLSPRANRAFVAVNCPALPENILETELFGHVKGAFTDAKQDKKGLFQEADHGTIFLDEIGDLPAPLQTKLLRVLQEREIKPVGSTQSHTVDVRVVASTNRNLQEQMAAGTFREDLYYRLNVVTIELPPLRERLEDLPDLVEHFLKRFAREYDRPGLRIPPGFMEALFENPWQGNIRELENVLKRSVIMARDETLAMPAPCGGEGDTGDPSLQAGQLDDLAYREAKETVLRTFNREYLTRLLIRHAGNVTHAAKACGLERQSLQQLLRRYGIRAETFRTSSS